jgi:Protein similar to CwfJ C-terminus 2
LKRPHWYVEFGLSAQQFYLIHEDDETWDVQFMRKVMVATLGCPEKADWKQAQLSSDDEKTLCLSWKRKYKPFDFTRNQ